MPAASTGILRTIRTLMEPFDPTRTPRSRADRDRGAHACARMTRQRAPELPLAATQKRSQFGHVARRCLTYAEHARTTNALQAQVVRILAPVVQLDSRRPRL